MGTRGRRNSTAPRPAALRARATNHTDLLPGVDGRSAMARRFRDIASAVTIDQGGADRLSEVRLQLCRRFAAAAVLAEAMEAKLATGQPIDISEHAQLCSSLCRLSNRIGLGRRAKNVVPTIEQYIEAGGPVDDEADT